MSWNEMYLATFSGAGKEVKWKRFPRCPAPHGGSERARLGQEHGGHEPGQTRRDLLQMKDETLQLVGCPTHACIPW